MRHRNIFFALLFFSLVSFSIPLFAQPVYLPVSHDVYGFLRKMEAKHYIDGYRDAAKPLSRLTIARSLRRLESQKDALTRVERDEYEFLKTEFQFELLKLAGDAEPSETRWHLWSGPLRGGVLNADVNYSLSRSQTDSGTVNTRSQGIRLYGYVYNDVGFYFNAVDNNEKGAGSNPLRINTPDPGIVVSKQEKGSVDYADIDAQFGIRLGGFDLSLEKNKNVWGFGERGSVIFSTKAPSYPQVKLRVTLSDDIDFIYFHGELNSNEIDSARSYFTHYPNSTYSAFREVDHSKYIAAHLLEISVLKNVDFSIGESIVYSDRGPLLIYMIPIMFFKAGEWYNRDKDNSQIFAALDVSALRSVDFYGTLFIDELNTDALTDPNTSRRQIAFTVGTHTYDLPWDNLEFLAEYTRGNPWIYNHKYTSANFTNNGFDLGDWIGQNADELYLEAAVNPLRGLKLSAFSEIYRKGGKADIGFQYTADGGRLPFLFRPQHIERSFGVAGRYQPIRDVFLDGMFRMHSQTDDAFPLHNHKNRPEFRITATLGLW